MMDINSSMWPIFTRMSAVPVYYPITNNDYMLLFITYVSFYLILEIIRFIEFKVKYNTSCDIILHNGNRTIEYNKNNNCINYYGNQYKIEHINGENLLILELEPTIHGTDNTRKDELTEYIITSIRHTKYSIEDEYFTLFLKPKNNIKYSFKN